MSYNLFIYIYTHPHTYTYTYSFSYSLNGGLSQDIEIQFLVLQNRTLLFIYFMYSNLYLLIFLI